MGHPPLGGNPGITARASGSEATACPCPVLVGMLREAERHRQAVR